MATTPTPTTFLSTLEADLAKVKSMSLMTAPFKFAFAPLTTLLARIKAYPSAPSNVVVDVALIAAGVFLAVWLWGSAMPSKPHFVVHKPAQVMPLLGF